MFYTKMKCLALGKPRMAIVVYKWNDIIVKISDNLIGAPNELFSIEHRFVFNYCL